MKEDGLEEERLTPEFLRKPQVTDDDFRLAVNDTTPVRETRGVSRNSNRTLVGHPWFRQSSGL